MEELLGKNILVETPTGWLFGTVKIIIVDGIEKPSIEFEDGTKSTNFSVEEIRQLVITSSRQEAFYGKRNFWEKLKSKYNHIRDILLRSISKQTTIRQEICPDDIVFLFNFHQDPQLRSEITHKSIKQRLNRFLPLINVDKTNGLPFRYRYVGAKVHMALMYIVDCQAPQDVQTYQAGEPKITDFPA